MPRVPRSGGGRPPIIPSVQMFRINRSNSSRLPNILARSHPWRRQVRIMLHPFQIRAAIRRGSPRSPLVARGMFPNPAPVRGEVAPPRVAGVVRCVSVAHCPAAFDVVYLSWVDASPVGYCFEMGLGIGQEGHCGWSSDCHNNRC